MYEKRGDWKKLTKHLIEDGRDEIKLTDDEVLAITGSVYQSKPLRIDHPENSIRDRAKDAGYDVTTDATNAKVKIFKKRAV